MFVANFKYKNVVNSGGLLYQKKAKLFFFQRLYGVNTQQFK